MYIIIYVYNGLDLDLLHQVYGRASEVPRNPWRWRSQTPLRRGYLSLVRPGPHWDPAGIALGNGIIMGYHWDVWENNMKNMYIYICTVHIIYIYIHWILFNLINLQKNDAIMRNDSAIRGTPWRWHSKISSCSNPSAPWAGFAFRWWPHNQEISDLQAKKWNIHILYIYIYTLYIYVCVFIYMQIFDSI